MRKEIHCVYVNKGSMITKQNLKFIQLSNSKKKKKKKAKFEIPVDFCQQLTKASMLEILIR